MPIYEFKCSQCEKVFEMLIGFKEVPSQCPECDGLLLKVPSVPGYRRDHTMIDGVKRK